MELRLRFNDGREVICRAAGDAVSRVVVRDVRLLVPKLSFNGAGQKEYAENYLKPFEWSSAKKCPDLGAIF